MAVALLNYHLEWDSVSKSYDVYYLGMKDKHVCRVFPYGGESGTLNDPKKMFTVKAVNYPGVGNIEQMVKGADLPEYVDSLRKGRGM